MSSAVAPGHDHPAVAWPPDTQYGSATPGKIGMWIFLVSDAFSFGGLLIAEGILHAGRHSWRPPGEPELGILFTAALTFILLATSLTNVLAWAAAVAGQRRRAALLLGLTALGGVAFLVGQVQEWFGIWSPGLLDEGLVFGRSARASTFYAITGYHGFHVLVGVLYILAILAGYLRRRVGERQIELLGLYWCFVDFVWAFIFSFVYLLPSLGGA
ncbi:MAG TPA: cytochrome c oxidase subunit 3 [Anaeromyxobacteraceae bacterium]|nr:cytochrome c oxidase subunit 3 [Anaeromyxobacteraceae bacterium]